jgi:hypothetical protein
VITFLDAESFGAWARAYNVQCVKFSSDGALIEAAFGPDFSSMANEESEEPSKPKGVTRALSMLAGDDVD